MFHFCFSLVVTSVAGDMAKCSLYLGKLGELSVIWQSFAVPISPVLALSLSLNAMLSGE